MVVVCSVSHYVKSTTKRCAGASTLIQLSQVGGILFVTYEQAEQLGEILRQRRRDLGLSTRQIAERSGVLQPTIVRLERGRFASPAPDKLAHIARALQLELADIYTHAGYIVPDQLPSIEHYLKVKYAHLPDAARNELIALASKLTDRHAAIAGRGEEAG